MATPEEIEKGDAATILGGKYQVGVRIGGGSFGEIFLARSLRTGEDLAVKVELVSQKSSQLRREAKIYLRLNGDGKCVYGSCIAELILCDRSGHTES